MWPYDFDESPRKRPMPQWLVRSISSILMHAIAIVFIGLCINPPTVDPVQIKKPEEIIDFKLVSPTFLEKKDVSELIEEKIKEDKIKAFLLLNEYINKKGDCYEIAIKFIKEFKNINKIKKVKISKDELMPGDLIYYSDNGMGQTHWAVYIDENIALQGSWTSDRRAKIGKVYYNTFAKPVFYRVEELKGE